MLLLTLKQIRSHNPCGTGWATLLDGLNKRNADDVLFSWRRIKGLNDVEDALWCLRCFPEHDIAVRKVTLRILRDEIYTEDAERVVWQQVAAILDDAEAKQAGNERSTNEFVSRFETCRTIPMLKAWRKDLDARRMPGAASRILRCTNRRSSMLAWAVCLADVTVPLDDAWAIDLISSMEFGHGLRNTSASSDALVWSYFIEWEDSLKEQ